MIWNSVIHSIEGSEQLEKLILFNRVKDEISELSVDGVFIYVGTIPNNQLVESRIKLDSSGFVLTDESMQTNIPGVYAAGDLVHKVLRQVVTAVSDGATAAFSAEKWIQQNVEYFNEKMK